MSVARALPLRLPAAAKVHPTAIVMDDVELGDGCTIGPFSIVYPGVRLGAGSFVGAHCELGVPLGGAAQRGDQGRLEIGAGAIIRSGSVLYSHSRYGERFECGHKATLREHTDAGHNLRVGTLCDVQGHCTFGDYVRLHGNVQVGQHSRIGDYVWIFPFVVLTNDPHPPSLHCIGPVVGDYAVVGAHSVLLAGVRVGRESVVAAGAIVGADIASGMLVGGHPAKVICEAAIVRDKFNPARKAYPWPLQFGRGLPWQDVGYAAWRTLNPDTPDTAPEPIP